MIVRERKNLSPQSIDRSLHSIEATDTFPSVGLKAMGPYLCKCRNCGDKVVSKATWYRHKKQGERRNMTYLYSAGASAGSGNSQTPGTPSSHLGDVYVKELSPEVIDLEANIKRAARSDSVGVVR